MPVYKISPNFFLFLKERTKTPIEENNTSAKLLAKKTIEKLLVRKMQEYKQLANIMFKFSEELDKKDKEIQKLKDELLSIELPKTYDEEKENIWIEEIFPEKATSFSKEKMENQFQYSIQQMIDEGKKEKEEKNQDMVENLKNMFYFLDMISDRKKQRNANVGWFEICSTNWFRPEKRAD